jgi:hypothetical protein
MKKSLRTKNYGLSTAPFRILALEYFYEEFTVCAVVTITCLEALHGRR